MKFWPDCSVDLETLDTVPGGVVFAIGAVMFDAVSGELGPTFYTLINVHDSLEHGLTISDDTLDWWARQSADARSQFEAAHAPTAPSLQAALLTFRNWLSAHSDLTAVKVWGNGSDFDNAMLAVLYRKVGSKTPWQFFNNRCYRTLKKLHDPHGVLFFRKGTYHNALDDATSQATHGITCLRKGRIVKPSLWKRVKAWLDA